MYIQILKIPSHHGGTHTPLLYVVSLSPPFLSPQWTHPLLTQTSYLAFLCGKDV